MQGDMNVGVVSAIEVILAGLVERTIGILAIDPRLDQIVNWQLSAAHQTRGRWSVASVTHTGVTITCVRSLNLNLGDSE